MSKCKAAGCSRQTAKGFCFQHAYMNPEVNPVNLRTKTNLDAIADVVLYRVPARTKKAKKRQRKRRAQREAIDAAIDAARRGW